MKLRSLVIALVLSAAFVAQGTVRYVDSAGNGAADGSTEADRMSYATFLDYMQTAGAVNAAAGDVFHIKSTATISRATTSDTWNQSTGTVGQPIIVSGYTTAINDGYQGRTNNTDALVITSMPLLTWTGTGQLTISGNHIWVQGLRVTGERNGPVLNVTGTNVLVRTCSVLNNTSGTSGAAAALAAQAYFYNSDFTLTNGGNNGSCAVEMSSTSDRMRFCRLTSTNRGILVSGSAQHLIQKNTIYDCTSHGIEVNSTSANIICTDNTIVSNGGDGIRLVSGQTLVNIIDNNMITDNTAYGINYGNTNVGAFVAYNRTRDNTSGASLSGGDSVTNSTISHMTTDGGDGTSDYTNYGTNTFSLKTTTTVSPAINAGWNYNNSIGAFQVPLSVGGGAVQHSFTSP
jgi:parallel beta-helix repeat protein